MGRRGGRVGKGVALFRDQRVQSVVVSDLGCTLEFPGLINIFIIRPGINKLASNI